MIPFVRRVSAVCSAVLALTCTLAACSSNDDGATPPLTTGSSGPSTSPATSEPTPTLPPLRTWPLTGRPLTGKMPAHPVYVVKVDNTSSAEPQVGLGDADLVVEELVEGGLTRLAAFYYSKIPPRVGPVRSMRASDIGITEPANAFIVASGAAGRTLRRLDRAGIVRITEGATGFYRSSTRVSPYNLIMQLRKLAGHVDRRWKPPSEPYLPFGPVRGFHGTVPVHRISAKFSWSQIDDWRFNGRTWVRANSLALPGHDFRADNVLILRVKIGDAGYLDPAGNPVPETFFFGSGAAILVHGDGAIRCTWHKAGTHGAVTLRDSHGKRVLVPIGRTFVGLVPANGGTVTLHP